MDFMVLPCWVVVWFDKLKGGAAALLDRSSADLKVALAGFPAKLSVALQTISLLADPS